MFVSSPGVSYDSQHKIIKIKPVSILIYENYIQRLKWMLFRLTQEKTTGLGAFAKCLLWG